MAKLKEKKQAAKAPKTQPHGNALRAARRKGLYAAQFQRTERNEPRRLRRHLRAHPLDREAAQIYQRKFGDVAGCGMTGLGKRRAARASNKVKQALFDAAAALA